MRQDVRTHAHDLNGALSAILASADLNARRDANGADTRAAFEKIAAAARRAGELVERLTAAATADEAGMEAASQRDLDYLERISGEPDSVLTELERSGHSEDIPIVDRETGRLLAVLVAAKHAEHVLELGTAFGYSTLWMARALPSGGRILTIDPDRERTRIARRFFERAGVAERIEIRNAPALEVLRELPESRFDVVFIDALKEEYSEYLSLAVPLLKEYGLLLVDNLLWGHRASMQPSETEADSVKAIRKFNAELLRHPRLLATIIPVGDGVGVATRVG
ncbi:MAG TPA: O-methyltransferase [Candidatus Acidoferrales bacterium]|nr:O-methyltransferase [Candidatus Acidoferrales bacterium]